MILAYHGCDITTRDDLVSGKTKSLNPSKNPYDWLGDGVYFYEADSERALQYAKYSAEHCELHLTAKAIGTPAVVGVVLDVTRWLDITTQAGIKHVTTALATVKSGFKESGTAMPENRPAFEGDKENLHRALDRIVFESLHSMRSLSQQRAIEAGNAEQIAAYSPFQAVRGAFTQGQAISDHSAIHGQSHIQIALRDNSCVLGWFLVPGDTLCNPNEYAEARSQLDAAKLKKSQAKPRSRGISS